MAGHLNFRHDRDVSRRRISDDFADVFLGVETAVTSVRAVSEAVFLLKAEPDFTAPRADFREFGIGFDFDAPALVVCQMPVKGV